MDLAVLLGWGGKTITRYEGHHVQDAAHGTILRKSIEAQYAQFNGSEEYCGNTKLNLSKVIDVICYLANSEEVTNLFKVKLMKMLWYVDSLSYKRRGVSMTGLAYKALPMGAVPIGHKTLLELQGVVYEEVDFGEAIGYRFIEVPDAKYEHLSEEDILIINEVIRICGRDTKDQIVKRMHSEKAYMETVQGDVIRYQYAKVLSLT